MVGEVAEDVGEGEGEGRGKIKDSFTLPSRGGGTPGVPGRWRGGVWRGTKCSLTVPGRGCLGGSPRSDDMSGGGVTFLPLGPIPPRSAMSGFMEGGKDGAGSTGTRIPPTITAEGTPGWAGGGERRCRAGGGGG